MPNHRGPGLRTTRVDRWFLSAMLAMIGIPIAAQQVNPPRATPPTIEIPLVDRDNVSEGVRGPSMAQSLALTADFYEIGHYAIEEAMPGRPRLAKWMIGLFDVGVTLIAPLPFTDVWLHEEWHRAVMSNRGIDSHNDVYRFDIAADAIAVSHVDDEDLVRLKRDHPADLPRLHAAGAEGEYALVQKLQRDTFFERTRGHHRPLYWIAKISTAGYIGSGTSDDVTEETHEWEMEEGRDIGRRDFAGHDFTAWMYDMSRRDEPYTARGTHPSGIGIRRYITPDMLTEDEKQFLDRQGKLQYLNFADPHLFGLNEFRTGTTRWMASAGHVLTPFGNAIDLNVLLGRERHDIAVVLRRYANHDRAFAGVDVTLVNEPLRVFGRSVNVSPRLAVWQQPADLRYRTQDAESGGLLGVRIESPVASRWNGYTETSVKTAGWVSGSVHLDAHFELRFGATVRLSD